MQKRKNECIMAKERKKTKQEIMYTSRTPKSDHFKSVRRNRTEKLVYEE